MTKILRYGYAPCLLLGVNAAALTLAVSGAAGTIREIGLIVLILFAVAISFAAERVIPYRAEWNGVHEDSGRDATHAFVNETMILLSVAIIPALAALSPVGDLWPDRLPAVLQFLLAILVADFGITTVHLASHKIGVLWRFHAVHHSLKRFYGFNGLMKHPLHQAIEMTAGVLPLIAFGIPVPIAGALAVAVAVQLLLQHSNADYRVGPLRGILALNEGHRFHHLKWAGIGDVNFGLFTLLWDHLYRTYSYDATRVFSTDDLGIAAKPDYPQTYLAQLAEPFRAS
jgi:sterol desaturase/sphingolipid hydroxylase (fatty acid hydroxylase superfamily)